MLGLLTNVPNANIFHSDCMLDGVDLYYVRIKFQCFWRHYYFLLMEDALEFAASFDGDAFTPQGEKITEYSEELPY